MGRDRTNTDSGSLAATASDQIRVIIEAAEQTAAQITTEAEQEAERIRREAEDEARGIRGQARGEIDALLESIRRGLSSASSGLEQLEQLLATPATASPPPTAPPPERPAAAAPAPAATRTASAPVAAETSGDADVDIESARLVALNMALDGNASRDDIDRYLSENFSLSDRKALLDDVYASLGG